MSQLENIDKYFTPEIVARFAEVQQSRSAFQLEKFVVNAHDTDEMRYFQIITEIQALYYTIKQVSLQMQKSQIEIARLKSTGDEIDNLDAEIKELGLEQTKIVSVGAFRELEILLLMMKKFPKYTRKQIEEAQPEYWNKRLTRQINQQILGGSQGVASNIEALNQIGTLNLPDKVITEGQK
jgi:hypothetical protein